MEEHDKRSFLLDLMDAAGLGAKDLDGEVGGFKLKYLPKKIINVYWTLIGYFEKFVWR